LNSPRGSSPKPIFPDKCLVLCCFCTYGSLMIPESMLVRQQAESAPGGTIPNASGFAAREIRRRESERAAGRWSCGTHPRDASGSFTSQPLQLSRVSTLVRRTSRGPSNSKHSAIPSSATSIEVILSSLIHFIASPPSPSATTLVGGLTSRLRKTRIVFIAPCSASVDGDRSESRSIVLGDCIQSANLSMTHCHSPQRSRSNSHESGGVTNAFVATVVSM
jgi:hypothetical protein